MRRSVEHPLRRRIDIRQERISAVEKVNQDKTRGIRKDSLHCIFTDEF